LHVIETKARQASSSRSWSIAEGYLLRGQLPDQSNLHHAGS
jgi:hypothetical protein